MNKKLSFLLFIIILIQPVSSQNTPFQLYNAGREAQLNNNYYSAIDAYKKALAKNANYKDPMFGLAESYFFISEFDQALFYINKSLELDHKNIEYKVFEARILIGLGEFEKAETLFLEIRKLEPNNIDAGFGLAELKIAGLKYKEAALTFEETLEFSAHNKRALLSLVMIYDQLGEFQLAEEHLRTALYYYSGDHQVRYIGAIHYYGNNYLKESETHLQAAMALKPDFTEAAKLLAEISFYKRDFSAAKKIIDDLIKYQKEDYYLYYLRGICHLALGNTAYGINDLTKVTVLKPDAEIPQIIVEEILLNNKLLLERFGNQYSKQHVAMGREYINKYMKKQGSEQFRRALQLDPDSFAAREEQGRLFKNDGYIGKYLGILEILQKQDPENINIKDELEITNSEREYSTSGDWNINQFSIKRKSINLSLFYSNSNKLLFQGSEVYLIQYLNKVYEGNDWLEIDAFQYAESFSDAFRDAREENSDYFIIISFSETERSFSLSAEIYKTSTGILIEAINIQHTGNNRVFESMVDLVDVSLHKFPLIGSIQKIKGEMCLVNIGLVDGLEIGDEIPVIKKDGIVLLPNDIGIDFPDNNVLGKIVITRVDDLISEAKIISAGIFNLINTGDELPYLFKNTETFEEKTIFEVNSVLLQLFQLQ